MDISEEIMKAIELIVDKKIEGMSADKTYAGVISAVNSNGYTVKYAGTDITIKTNATNRFKIGDSVKLCIPCGNKQKAFIVVDIDMID